MASEKILRDDRRRNKSSSRMPAVLAIALSVLFGVGMIGLMFVEIPSGNKEVFVVAFGSLSTMLGVAIGYYYNTTHASKQKDQVISDIVSSDSFKGDQQ